uniref:Uncharacterized protein n=1 Tax=Parascaris equorum TaxID=6256 RepID=A0A914R4Y1_PAREQ
MHKFQRFHSAEKLNSLKSYKRIMTYDTMKLCFFGKAINCC